MTSKPDLADDDGPLYSFDNAPMASAEDLASLPTLSDEEHAAIEREIEDIRAGRVQAIPHEVVHAMIERACEAMKRFGPAAEGADITVGEILHWLDTGEPSPAIAALLAREPPPPAA